MSAAEFAVIMTVRNGEAHLACALRSVLQQDIIEWEMVCYSDGSTDATADILREYTRRDSRFRMVESAAVGRATALNAAVRLTGAQRIVILDADDALHPSCLRHHSDQYNGELKGIGPRAIVGCNVGLVFGSSEPVWNRLFSPVPLTEVTNNLATCNPVAHTGVCYSRALFESIGGYNVSQPGALDYRFYVDAVKHGARVFRMSEVLVAKRIHSGQSFERRNRIQYLKAGLSTQLDAGKVLGKGAGHRLLAYCRFAYGLLPRFLRLTRYRRT